MGSCKKCEAPDGQGSYRGCYTLKPRRNNMMPNREDWIYTAWDGSTWRIKPDYHDPCSPFIITVESRT